MLKKSPAFALALLLALGAMALGPVALAADPLHAGKWSKKSFSISGDWNIVEEGGKRFLVLSDDFSTKKAPDLKLFLSKNSLGDASGKNATKNAVLVAELKTNKGGQRYEIPSFIDLDAYNTLLLHCEKYSKLWGGSALR